MKETRLLFRRIPALNYGLNLPLNRDWVKDNTDRAFIHATWPRHLESVPVGSRKVYHP